jgi:hypothetical protein
MKADKSETIDWKAVEERVVQIEACNLAKKLTAESRIRATATPTGKGYYIVMEDGGVHARGDAVWYGSTGGNKPGGHDITGMALSLSIGSDGKINGYWLVASDGGVHTFGSAPFWGSTGGDNKGSPVTGIVSFPAPNIFPVQRTRGHAWVNTRGGVTVVPHM